MKRAITDHAGTHEGCDGNCIILGFDARSAPHNFGEASIAGRPPDEAFLLLEPGADPVFRTHVAGSVTQALVVGNRPPGSALPPRDQRAGSFGRQTR